MLQHGKEGRGASERATMCGVFVCVEGWLERQREGEGEREREREGERERGRERERH
jgi:hypothetical protein